MATVGEESVTASSRLWATVGALRGQAGIAGDRRRVIGSGRDYGRQWDNVRVSQGLRATVRAYSGSFSDCGGQWEHVRVSHGLLVTLRAYLDQSWIVGGSGNMSESVMACINVIWPVQTIIQRIQIENSLDRKDYFKSMQITSGMF